jgi:hypothetical protein
MSKKIQTYDEMIEDFISYMITNTEIYIRFQEKGYLKISESAEERFFEIIKDVHQACSLSDEAKQRTENLTDELLKDCSKIHIE